MISFHKATFKGSLSTHYTCGCKCNQSTFPPVACLTFKLYVNKGEKNTTCSLWMIISKSSSRFNLWCSQNSGGMKNVVICSESAPDMQKHWFDPSETDGAASQRVTNIWVTARCCLFVVLLELPLSGGAARHSSSRPVLLCDCWSRSCFFNACAMTWHLFFVLLVLPFSWNVFVFVPPPPSPCDLTHIAPHMILLSPFHLGNILPLRRQEAICGYAGKTADGRRCEENVWAVWQHRGVHGTPWAWWNQ